MNISGFAPYMTSSSVEKNNTGFFVKAETVPLPKEPSQDPGDSVSIKSGAGYTPVVKKEDGSVPKTDSEILAALDKILDSKEPSDQKVNASQKNTSSSPTVLAFDLDGSSSLGSANSLGIGPMRVPVRQDVADYAFIEPKDAEANYNNEVKPNLGFVEKRCIKAYCTFAYKMMNQYLTGAKGSPTGTIRRAVKSMTGALERFPVPQGSVLYRTSNINELHNYVNNDDFAKYEEIDKQGKTKELAELLDLRLQGTETKRKTFISTTIDPGFDFEDKPKVATKMYVGDNVNGIYVAADKSLSRFPDEKEYLLAPDTKATVLGVDYNDKNKGLVLHVLLGDLPAGLESKDVRG